MRLSVVPSPRRVKPESPLPWVVRLRKIPPTDEVTTTPWARNTEHQVRQGPVVAACATSHAPAGSQGSVDDGLLRPVRGHGDPAPCGAVGLALEALRRVVGAATQLEGGAGPGVRERLLQLGGGGDDDRAGGAGVVGVLVSQTPATPVATATATVEMSVRVLRCRPLLVITWGGSFARSGVVRPCAAGRLLVAAEDQKVAAGSRTVAAGGVPSPKGRQASCSRWCGVVQPGEVRASGDNAVGFMPVCTW
ncbi:hypothetical protein SBADM41S_05770 [Streptomyces badius]